MKFKLEKIPELSGIKASIYTVLPEGSSTSLFDDFIFKNKIDHESEVIDIIKRIRLMATQRGALEQFFKLNEGAPGDLVCALYDKPRFNLRLYCIRFGSTAIILGGGGHKRKTLKAWQEDPALTKSVSEMINISECIYRRILDKQIKWSQNQIDLVGDLDFKEDD